MKCFSLCALFLLSINLYSQDYGTSFIAFENAVYAEVLPTKEILPLYNKAVSDVNIEKKEEEQLSYLASCQELLGRHYLAVNDKTIASNAFEQGIRYADESLEIVVNANAYAVYAQNITQNMRTKSVSYMISQGLKLNGIIKKSLELDSSSVLARYLLLSSYIFPPAAFANEKKGLQLIEEIFADKTISLSQAMQFNLYTAAAKAYLMLKKNDLAKEYISLAKEIFPENSYLNELEKTLKH